MKKNTVYTEVLGGSKKAALLIALGNFPEIEHREVVTQIHLGDYIPLTLDEAAVHNTVRLENLYADISDSKPGDVFITIQKGVQLDSDFCGLFACLCHGIVNSKGAIEVSVPLFTEGILLPKKLRALVEEGMHLYNAYGSLFGEELLTKNLSLYEFMTGEKEEVWLSRSLFGILLPQYGPRRELFKL